MARAVARQEWWRGKSGGVATRTFAGVLWVLRWSWMLVSVFGVAFWWVLTVMWVCWVGGGLVYVFAGKIAGFCGILLGVLRA
ncbi:MAG: hypothetical protein QXT00_02380 [Ignisphaera sp.]